LNIHPSHFYMKTLLLTLSIIICTRFVQSQNSTGRIEAANGKVVGMSSSGGNKGYGVIYQYDLNSGKDTVPVNFNNGAVDGVYPFGSLMQASDGLLYGMTINGGTYGYGVLFSFNPITHKDTVLVNFNGANGKAPYQSNLIQATNGLLYGLTENGGTNDDGVLFSYNIATHQETVLVNLVDSIGVGPFGSLIQATDGMLYGMTVTGGANFNGVIFRYDIIHNKDTVVFSFDGSAYGGSPWGSLLQASDGKLYGMTQFGGTNSQGVIFRFNPVTYDDTVMFNFDGNAYGGSPEGSLIQATNGKLYGMTEFGGSNGDGILFRLDPITGDDSVLLNFNGTDGSSPMGSLMQASNGLLYGMTWSGGTSAYGNGTFFSYNITTEFDSVITNFHDLGTAPGAGEGPYGNIMQATNGKFYGLTQSGGQYNEGVLFSYKPGDPTDSTLHSFGGNSNTGNLIEGSNGYLFGMTEFGGTSDLGTIFRYDPVTGKDTTVLSFNGTNGSQPVVNNSLMQGSNGWLYGMTEQGGPDNLGVMFMFNPTTFKDSVLVNFNGTNGDNPLGGLVQANDGNLYGMTVVGGTHNDGLLFKYSPTANTITTLVNFDSTNGSWPEGSLIQASNGLLYGMTYWGGTYNYGIIFSYDITNSKDSVVHSFNDTAGGYPYGALLQASNGMLYGLTSWGGPTNDGTLFRFNTTNNADTVLLNFNYTNGASPQGQLIQDSTAAFLYGTTPTGGAYNYGVFFRYDLTTNKDTTLLTFNDTNGANPTSILFLNVVPLSVNEVKPTEKDIILVYPNPFSKVATVLFNEEGTHYVEIDDISGRQLKYITADGKRCEISRDNIAAGLYIVKVYDTNKHLQATTKIEVQ